MGISSWSKPAGVTTLRHSGAALAQGTSPIAADARRNASADFAKMVGGSKGGVPLVVVPSLLRSGPFIVWIATPAV